MGQVGARRAGPLKRMDFKMKKLPGDAYIKRYVNFAREYQSFTLRLSINRWTDIGLKEQQQILSNVIKPLFKGAVNAFLYNEWDSENEYYSPILAEITKKKRNRHELLLDKDLFKEEHTGFCGDEAKKRGTIIWENDINNINWNSLFKASKDPYVLGNPGSVLPKSAIKNAKKLTKEFDTKVVFFLSSSDGLGEIIIFMNSENAGDYARQAIMTCELSDSYLLHKNE